MATQSSIKGPLYIVTDIRDPYWTKGVYYYDTDFQSIWIKCVEENWEYIGKPGTFEPIEEGDIWNKSRKGFKYVPYTGQTWRKRV